jgi:hypothetical protein
MITGFNTDVRFDGRVYHVQTEDRGQSNPVLESLVYIGGTVVASKRTPYADQLSDGATEEIIASQLKRQHQVIIAAIKAGRVEDLIRHSAKENGLKEIKTKQAKPKSVSGALSATPVAASLTLPAPSNRTSGKLPALPKAASGKLTPLAGTPIPAKPLPATPMPATPMPATPPLQAEALSDRAAPKNRTAPLGSPRFQPPPFQSLPFQSPPFQPPPFQSKPPAASSPVPPVASNQNSNLAGLDLDQVISDYLKRSSEQGKLDLKVITPGAFIAGKNIGLRVQVAYGADPEPEAVVTIKVIGTAFKPQVYIGRAGRDGVASFSLSLPAFTAGTAAIVIEAQSNRGRGELKHLIRRS